MEVSRVFNLSADHVALDFVNTLDDRFAPDARVEKLESYADFLSFAKQSGVLTASEASNLAKAAKSGKAAGALRTAINLREVLARIFYSLVEQQRVARGDLQELNKYFQQASRHRVLLPEEGGLSWRWEGLDKNLEAPLWPVAQAAADLLASSHVKLIRACARESCRWLFLDVSKNHSRRWCDMKVCGNRVKAHRYYALHTRE